MDEVQIHISAIQILQTTGNTILHAMVPRIVQLSRHPDLFSRHTAVFDPQSYLSFIAIGKSGVDVSVAALQSGFDGVANFIRLRLPCSQANGRNLGTGVEFEGLPEEVISKSGRERYTSAQEECLLGE